MCSITDTEGPVKTQKPKKQGECPKNHASIQNMSIKEENLALNAKPTSMVSGVRANSHASKAISSDNSRKLSEMSLILTPNQVKKKQEKFTQSLKQIGSLKSKFGSFRQTRNVSEKSIEGHAKEYSKQKTGFYRDDARFSDPKKDDVDALTQKTNLSESDESMFKMFRNLNLSADSEGKELDLYSGKSGENEGSGLGCFLDEAQTQMLKTPMAKNVHLLKGNSKSSRNSGVEGGHVLTKFKQGSGRFKIGWKGTESEEGLEKSADVSGGFDLMNLMERPLLNSDKFPKKFNDNLRFGTSQTLVGRRLTPDHELHRKQPEAELAPVLEGAGIGRVQRLQALEQGIRTGDRKAAQRIRENPGLHAQRHSRGIRQKRESYVKSTGHRLESPFAPNTKRQEERHNQ